MISERHLINSNCAKSLMKNTLLSFTNIALIWLVIAASFSINLPIAFGSISLGLFVMLWPISGGYSAKFALIKSNPGALIALALLALYGLGVTYSSASLHDSFHYLMKYAKFLLIPLIVAAFVSDRHRQYAINAFLISLIGYLVVSYLNWFGFFSFGVMRHGTYMALGFYLMLRNAKRKTGQFRMVWLVLSALTYFNILFIADVRTGVITMFALLFMFAFETWRSKGLMYWLALAIVTVIALKIAPEMPNLRIVGMEHEVATNKSSAGQRLEMYGNTLRLISSHPFFGGGTGSIEGEYTSLIKGDPSVYIRKVTNPHNQYLMTTQELGLLGLLMLVLFWCIHWRSSYQLQHQEYGYFLRALIVSTAVGSLFNSLLLDSGDGRMYCVLAGVLLSSYKPKAAAFGSELH